MRSKRRYVLLVSVTTHSTVLSALLLSKDLSAVSGFVRRNIILNRQYSRSDYEALSKKIRAKMEQPANGAAPAGEYSPYGYNETVAQGFSSEPRRAFRAIGNGVTLRRKLWIG
jgi:hypothetical protein